MKRLRFLLWLMLLVFGLSMQALALSEYDTVTESFDFQNLEDATPDDLITYYREIGLTPGDVDALQERSLPDMLWERLCAWLSDAHFPIGMIRTSVGLCLLSFCLRCLSESHLSWTKTVTNRSAVVLCATVLIEPIFGLIQDTSSAISSGCVYLSSFVPIYAGLLTASGYPSLSGTYTTVLVVYSQVLSFINGSVLVPAGCATLALCVCLSLGGMDTTPLIGLRKAILTVISAFSGILTAIVSLQTKLSAATDNLVIKSAKTVLTSFVPLVGTTLSESLNVVVESLELARSSVGIYTILTVVLLFFEPMLNLLCWQLVLVFVKMLFASCGNVAVMKMLECVTGIITILTALVLSSVLMIVLTSFTVLSVGKGG